MNTASPEAPLQAMLAAMRQIREQARSIFDPIEFRQFAAGLDAPATILDPALPFTETLVGGIRCERVGEVADGPVLLYLHGGGFMLPPHNGYRLALQKMTRRLAVEALMPRYRLTPEHPFPAAVDDCLAVYVELVRRGRRVVIAGDSAGGGLAVSLVLRAARDGWPAPVALYLMSPFTDLACSGSSVFTKSAVDACNFPEALLHKSYHYLAGRSPTDPIASPFYGDLRGLPPTLIHVGGDEIMLDDSVRFAERALQQGSPVTCKVYTGMPHVFPTLPFIPECEAALMVGTDFLARQLAGTGPV